MANFQKDKKYHFTYNTTNIINKRYYLGMHSTNNLNDNYVGSGKRLWHEIRKYGKENFKLKILNYYNSREELINAEKVLITENDLNNNNCLNLKLGGRGGFNLEDIKKGNIAGNKAFKEKLKDPVYKAEFIKKCKCIETLRKVREEGKIVKNTFLGKKHSEETKQKMSEIKKGEGKGKSNSQYNTMWITNGKENKKIKITEKIPLYWNKGRTMVP